MIKRSIPQEDKAFVSVYALNIDTYKYIKQIQTVVKKKERAIQ